MGLDFELSPSSGRGHGPAGAGGRDRRRRLRQDDADGGPGRLPRRDRTGPRRAGARPDLHDQGGRRAAPADPGRARPAGLLGRPACGPRSPPTTTTRCSSPRSRPTTRTPPRLLVDHGLRIGHEPETRVMADASRYQLGPRVVERFTGDVHHLTDNPPTAIENLLALDSAMSEHLVGPDEVAASAVDARAGFERARDEELAGKGRKGHRRGLEKTMNKIDRARASCSAGRGLPPAQARPRADGLLRPDRARARLAREQPEVGVAERDRFRVVLLDEYQDTSVAQAMMLARLFSGPDAGSRPWPPGHGGRRPQPGDLRLARRLGLQHPGLRRDLPGADGAPPSCRSRQPALRHAGSSRSANRLAHPAAREVRRPGAGLEPKPGAADGRVRDAGVRAPPRRARLAGRGRPRGPRRPRTATRGPTSASSPATTPRRGGLRRPHRLGHPGGDRRPVRPGPAARGRRGRRRPHPACTTSPTTPRC